MPVLVLDESNVLEVTKWGRGGYADLVNQIVMVYRDANTNKDVPVVVQNSASIAAQGCVVSETINRDGYSNQALASRAALRELKVRSVPLAKGSLIADRSARFLLPADQFLLIWPKRNIASVFMRVTSIETGELTDNRVKIDFVEDVFSIPVSSYSEAQPSLSSPDPVDPEVVSVWELYESPYWMLWSGLDATRLSQLGADDGYVGVLAQAPTGYHLSFDMHSHVSPSAFSATYSDASFNSSAVLTSAITQSVTTGIAIESSQITTDSLNSIVMIGSGQTAEWAQITGGDYASTLNLKRGLFDSVPRAHPAGTRIWKVGYTDLFTTVKRTNAEAVEVALITYAPGGALPTADAYGSTLTITMNRRQIRPYTGGAFKLNNVSTYPSTINTANVAVTWAHRDRTVFPALTQSDASVGPEATVTYTAYLYDDDTETLLDTLTGITGTSWTAYPFYSGNFRIELEAVKGSYVSWQRQHCAFSYTYYTESSEESGEAFTDEAGNTLDYEY